jgi:diguanylate cyclase (GGDEF)-like protein
VLESVNRVVVSANQTGSYDEGLADLIAEDSYQIDSGEAGLIAAVLADMKDSSGGAGEHYAQIFLEQDMLLGEPAFAAVYEMPKTYWKIVTVMPYSRATAVSNLIYTNLITYIVAFMLVALAAVLFVIRKILVRPISNMSGQLKVLTESDDPGHRQLKVSDSGELGTLAFWFNERSRKLHEVQQELRKAHEDVESRVIERTEELRHEIDRRKNDELVKEARAARVMNQHAAIVELSTHDTLSKGDIVEAAKTINKIAADVVNVERCGIWLLDKHNEYIRCVDIYERSARVHSGNLSLKVEDYPVYTGALKKDRSIAVYDLYEDSRTLELSDYAKAHGVVSLLDSPIRVGGEFRGVVCFEQVDDKREWHRDEIRFCGEIADQFQQALTNAERMQSDEQIRQLAFYDPLTNLANRRLLQEEVQHELEVARRQGLFGSIVYLDLDNFKMLNDSLGHALGDELLIQLSGRLRSMLRREDTASRLGGDEFVIMISGESVTRHEAMEQALSVAQKIQAAISEPYRLQGYEHIITSSMGVTPRLTIERSKRACPVRPSSMSRRPSIRSRSVRGR